MSLQQYFALGWEMLLLEPLSVAYEGEEENVTETEIHKNKVKAKENKEGNEDHTFSSESMEEESSSSVEGKWIDPLHTTLFLRPTPPTAKATAAASTPSVDEKEHCRTSSSHPPSTLTSHPTRKSVEPSRCSLTITRTDSESSCSTVAAGYRAVSRLFFQVFTRCVQDELAYQRDIFLVEHQPVLEHLEGVENRIQQQQQEQKRRLTSSSLENPQKTSSGDDTAVASPSGFLQRARLELMQQMGGAAMVDETRTLVHLIQQEKQQEVKGMQKSAKKDTPQDHYMMYRLSPPLPAHYEDRVKHLVVDAVRYATQVSQLSALHSGSCDHSTGRRGTPAKSHKPSDILFGKSSIHSSLMSSSPLTQPQGKEGDCTTTPQRHQNRRYHNSVSSSHSFPWLTCSSSSPLSLDATSVLACAPHGPRYGDPGQLLYYKYPPPLLQESSFSLETLRLYIWLKTWQRKQEQQTKARETAAAAARLSDSKRLNISSGASKEKSNQKNLSAGQKVLSSTRSVNLIEVKPRGRPRGVVAPFASLSGTKTSASAYEGTTPEPPLKKRRSMATLGNAFFEKSTLDGRIARKENIETAEVDLINSSTPSCELEETGEAGALEPVKQRRKSSCCAETTLNRNEVQTRGPKACCKAFKAKSKTVGSTSRGTQNKNFEEDALPICSTQSISSSSRSRCSSSSWSGVKEAESGGHDHMLQREQQKDESGVEIPTREPFCVEKNTGVLLRTTNTSGSLPSVGVPVRRRLPFRASPIRAYKASWMRAAHLHTAVKHSSLEADPNMLQTKNDEFLRLSLETLIQSSDSATQHNGASTSGNPRLPFLSTERGSRYVDAFGNPIRSARLAVKEEERKVLEAKRERRRAKCRGYFPLAFTFSSSPSRSANRAPQSPSPEKQGARTPFLSTTKVKQQHHKSRHRGRGGGAQLRSKSSPAAPRSILSAAPLLPAMPSLSMKPRRKALRLGNGHTIAPVGTDVVEEEGGSDASSFSRSVAEQLHQEDNDLQPLHSGFAIWQAISSSSTSTTRRSSTSSITSTPSRVAQDLNDEKCHEASWRKRTRHSSSDPSSATSSGASSSSCHSCTTTSDDESDEEESDEAEEGLHADLYEPSAVSCITNIAVISGSHGCGKTAAVYLAASLLQSRVVEVNSSVLRTPKTLATLVAELTKSQHLSHWKDASPNNHISSDTLNEGNTREGTSSSSPRTLFGGGVVRRRTAQEELEFIKQKQLQEEAERRRQREEAEEEERQQKAKEEELRKKRQKKNVICAQAIQSFFSLKPPPPSSSSNTVEPGKSESAQEELKTAEQQDSKALLSPQGLSGTQDGSDGVPLVPPSRKSIIASVTAASLPPPPTTILLVEDADILLSGGEEAHHGRAVYNAICEMAAESQIPILLTVNTPSPESALSSSSVLGPAITSEAGGTKGKRSGESQLYFYSAWQDSVLSLPRSEPIGFYSFPPPLPFAIRTASESERTGCNGGAPTRSTASCWTVPDAWNCTKSPGGSLASVVESALGNAFRVERWMTAQRELAKQEEFLVLAAQGGPLSEYGGAGEDPWGSLPWEESYPPSMNPQHDKTAMALRLQQPLCTSAASHPSANSVISSTTNSRLQSNTLTSSWFPARCPEQNGKSGGGARSSTSPLVSSPLSSGGISNYSSSSASPTSTAVHPSSTATPASPLRFTPSLVAQYFGASTPMMYVQPLSRLEVYLTLLVVGAVELGLLEYGDLTSVEETPLPEGHEMSDETREKATQVNEKMKQHSKGVGKRGQGAEGCTPHLKKMKLQRPNSRHHSILSQKKCKEEVLFVADPENFLYFSEVLEDFVLGLKSSLLKHSNVPSISGRRSALLPLSALMQYKTQLTMTTDIRYWLNQLQYLLLGFRGSWQKPLFSAVKSCAVAGREPVAAPLSTDQLVKEGLLPPEEPLSTTMNSPLTVPTRHPSLLALSAKAISRSWWDLTLGTYLTLYSEDAYPLATHQEEYQRWQWEKLYDPGEWVPVPAASVNNGSGHLHPSLSSPSPFSSSSTGGVVPPPSTLSVSSSLSFSSSSSVVWVEKSALVKELHQGDVQRVQYLREKVIREQRPSHENVSVVKREHPSTQKVKRAKHVRSSSSFNARVKAVRVEENWDKGHPPHSSTSNILQEGEAQLCKSGEEMKTAGVIVIPSPPSSPDKKSAKESHPVPLSNKSDKPNPSKTSPTKLEPVQETEPIKNKLTDFFAPRITRRPSGDDAHTTAKSPLSLSITTATCTSVTAIEGLPLAQIKIRCPPTPSSSSQLHPPPTHTTNRECPGTSSSCSVISFASPWTHLPSPLPAPTDLVLLSWSSRRQNRLVREPAPLDGNLAWDLGAPSALMLPEGARQRRLLGWVAMLCDRVALVEGTHCSTAHEEEPFAPPTFNSMTTQLFSSPAYHVNPICDPDTFPHLTWSGLRGDLPPNRGIPAAPVVPALSLSALPPTTPPQFIHPPHHSALESTHAPREMKMENGKAFPAGVSHSSLRSSTTNVVAVARSPIVEEESHNEHFLFQRHANHSSGGDGFRVGSTGNEGTATSMSDGGVCSTSAAAAAAPPTTTSGGMGTRVGGSTNSWYRYRYFMSQIDLFMAMNADSYTPQHNDKKSTVRTSGGIGTWRSQKQQQRQEERERQEAYQRLLITRDAKSYEDLIGFSPLWLKQ